MKSWAQRKADCCGTTQQIVFNILPSRSSYSSKSNLKQLYSAVLKSLGLDLEAPYIPFSVEVMETQSLSGTIEDFGLLGSVLRCFLKVPKNKNSALLLSGCKLLHDHKLLESCSSLYQLPIITVGHLLDFQEKARVQHPLFLCCFSQKFNSWGFSTKSCGLALT